MRVFTKKIRVTRWRTKVKALLLKLDSWAQNIKAKRAVVDFGPGSADRMGIFLAKEEEAARATVASREARLDATAPMEVAAPAAEESDDEEEGGDDDDEFDGGEAEEGSEEGAVAADGGDYGFGDGDYGEDKVEDLVLSDED